MNIQPYLTPKVWQHLVSGQFPRYAAYHGRLKRPILLRSGEIIAPTRRGLITGLSSMAIAVALCPKPLWAAKYADYYSALSVKDPTFGAVGNGVTDDRAAIQACIDAAFGTAASPHGNNSSLNKAVYFPSGVYSTQGPLYLTHVVGGRLFGNGQGSSRISYNGAFNGNNVANADNSITPLIMTDGFSYSSITDLALTMSSDNNSVCFYLFANNASGSAGNGNLFQNLLVSGPVTAGLLIGYMSPNLCSECTYIAVSYSSCGFAGLRVIDQNTLNHWCFGGGAQLCGNGGHGAGSAAYSCPTGAIPVVSGGSFAQNLWDIDTNAASPMLISGVRTESLQFANLQTGNYHVSGCIQDINTATKFAAVADKAIFDVCRSLGTAAVISGVGTIYLRGNSWVNANVVAAFAGNVAQNI